MNSKVYLFFYPDVNDTQWRLIRTIVGSTGRLTAVGDDDQNIYQFRGSDAFANFSSILHEFPDCKVMRLETNYRSTRAIVNVGTSCVTGNTNRIEKQLVSHGGNSSLVNISEFDHQYAEARGIAETIDGYLQNGRAAHAGEIAVLYRCLKLG
jgi:superfamily I DNA/RNA helicase